MKRRILSIITALALCLSLCPTWAFATEADPSLCKHHPAHTADCGYAAPTEGHDCGHEHTEDCYTTDEAGGKVLDCQHSHNSECGYVQADPGTPCGYVCRICPIEDLIAALPDKVTEDNADDVRAQLDKILALYRELDEGEQEEIDLSRCYELQEALDNANAPMQAAGEINISQNRQNILTEEDGGCQGHTFTGTAQATMIYVESGAHDVTFADLNITASAMVGVAPGVTMNLTIEGTNTISAGINYAGIYVPKDAILVITDGSTGKLEVSSPTDAGIGGAWTAPDDTTGDVDCGTVVINGGTITATGGGSNSASAGIGGSGGDDNPGNGGNVTISGGTVTATGGSDSGGNYGGAGIGGGSNGNEFGNGGTLTISGGHVTLAPGAHNTQWGTAYGFGRGSCTPNASTGTCELTLADASYLDSGTTLDPKGKYTINGDPTADMIVVPEDLIYSGKAQELAGRIYIDDSKTGTGTYFGQTFTVNASADGWVLQDLGEVVEAKEYTATFTKGDQSISKKFTVAKSGTQFVEDGEVKTYNGETQTDTFTAGDTITVKATPTPTGKAPDNSAMFAASFTAPGAGQMAVFVGTTQVSVSADKGEDGSYTMTVSAADVLLAAGGPKTGITLTARFIANDNMADGAGTVKVNITAAAKAERDGAVIGYYGENNLADAFANSGNAGATFTLLANVERPSTLSISINCTLDLNGKTIRSTGEYAPALDISSGATVTIRGEGEIIPKQSHALVVLGSVTLEGGTFTSNGENFAGVYVNGGTLSITGEKVVIQNTSNGGYGLAVNSAQSVQLSAGTYKGEKAVSIVSDTITLGDLLDGGCAYHSGDTPIALEAGGKELTGTVTVKACTHTGEGVCTYTHNENTSTHTKTCLACGNTWEAEDCDYGEYTHNDTSHTRICKLCEYQNVEAHNIECTAEASGTVIAVSEACKTCGYGKDLGTVTIHIPKLVYGDLTGVVTAETTLTETVVVAVRVDNNPSGSTTIFPLEPPTMATLTGNALLSAGTHQIKIEIIIIRDENALAECELTFNVAPAPLTPSITGTATKPYDGTTDVASGQLSITLTGVVGSDDVTAVATSYAYDNTNAGENKTITASGITLKGDSKDNYTLSSTTATTTGTITKSQPTIVFASGYNPSKTYDGQTISNPTADDLTITGAAFGNVDFTWYAGNVDEANKLANPPKDAGTYTLTASIPVTNNTEAASATLTVTISPKAVTPTVTITPGSYKYTGSAIHPSGSAVKVMDGDTVIPDSEYTLSYGENTQVGTGSVTVTDKENGNYKIAQATGTFAITKANQAPLTITGAPGSVTYGDTFQLGVSGGSGTGALSWAASGATVDNAGNVTITRAGTVAITAVKEGDSNYVGTEGRIMLDVSKKALTVTGATAQDRQYDGTSAVKITGVTLDGIVGSDAVSVSTANLTGTLNGSNVGSYTAVTLPALTLTGGGADNYTLTRPAGAVSTSVTISKAAARTPKTGDLAVANKQAHTYTFGLGALRPDLPAGMSFGSSAVTYTLDAVSLGSYYDSSANSAKIEGQTLTLPIQAVESNKAEGVGTITVTIHTGNFEDMTATINVRSVNKTIPTGAPTLSAATLTYGQPLSTITLQGDMAAGATPVPGKFEWSSPDNRPAVQEAYAAAWVFTPTDNNTYAIVNGTSTIKVVPASVAGAVVTLSPTSFRYDGQTHSPTVTSVKLGDTTLTADTDYTVEIPIETAAGTYTVTITGKGNYTGTAAATFTINPVETGDEFEDESGTTLRLEVETGLSTVPEALKNNTKYDTPAKIEAELRTQVEQVMSNVGENIAVFDVTLQYKDASGTWHTVDPDDFPTEGVTAILPYPDGTGATGYTFTVQHLISSGTQAGTMETLSYTLTADGLQCKFLSLSPVAIGYQAAAKPVDPVHPNPGGSSGGGGGGVSTYAVTVEKSEHGKVTSNRTNASNGSTVTLTVTPDTDYVLDTLTVTDSRGNEIRLTAQGNGKYTFTMPGRAVTVRAAFAPLPEDTEKPCDGGVDCPSHGFTDLGTVGTWYHEAVDYVLRNNLMGGYGNGTFGPNDTLTRAQFAQILYNKEGRPVVNYLLQFTDVSGEAWYTEAVRWAASQGIVGGYADGRFGPNDNITREQLAVMLWRYAGSPAATDKELHFNDADKVGAYARDAMRWAVENGVISGKGGGILDPKGLATRAQTAQMLKNYLDGQSE